MNNIKIAYTLHNNIYIMSETYNGLEIKHTFVIRGVLFINKVIYNDSKIFVYANLYSQNKIGILFYFNYNENSKEMVTIIDINNENFLLQGEIFQFTIDNNNIYFTVNEGQSYLYCKNINEVIINRVIDDKIICSKDKNSFLINDNIVYYINGSDNGKLYKFNIATNNNEKIYDECIVHIEIENNRIYFISEKGNAGYYEINLRYNNSQLNKINIFAKVRDREQKFFHGTVIDGSHVITNHINKSILFSRITHEQICDIVCFDDYCYILTFYFYDDYGFSEECFYLYKLTWNDVCDYKNDYIDLSNYVYEFEQINAITVFK